MRTIDAMGIVVALACVTGCGKKDSSDKGDTKDKATKAESKEKADPTGEADSEKPTTPATTCAEKHELAITFTGKELAPAPPAGPFAASNSVGYVTGMSWSGGTVSKLAHVVVANYPAKVEQFSFQMPASADQIAVDLVLNSKAEPAEVADQKAVYAKLAVAPGDYPLNPGSNDPNVNIYIFVGQPAGNGITSATGGAKVTTFAPDRVCGSIDLTSAEGTTIKGTFNVALEKDLWAP